jgi:hypothetical protein
MIRALTFTLFVLLGVAIVAGTAAASPVSPGVVSYLAEHPGGKLIGGNEISYDDGRFVVTITPPEHINGYVDCPKGWFCFYDRADFGYPRGRLSSCYGQSLATWGWQDRVESAYYNIDRGYVWFFDYGAPLFSIGAGFPSRDYLGSAMNRATDVYRFFC